MSYSKRESDFRRQGIYSGMVVVIGIISIAQFDLPYNPARTVVHTGYAIAFSMANRLLSYCN